GGVVERRPERRRARFRDLPARGGMCDPVGRLRKLPRRLGPEPSAGTAVGATGATEESARPGQMAVHGRGHAGRTGRNRIGVGDAVARLAAAGVASRCAVGRVEERTTIDAGAPVAVVMADTDLDRALARKPADVGRPEGDVVDAPVAVAAALGAYA